MSECYKTVTKDLQNRTQIALQKSESKFKFSAVAGSGGDSEVLVADNNLQLVRELLPQVLFHYSDAKKSGSVDALLVVLQQICEENLVFLVFGAFSVLFVLLFVVSFLTCLLLGTKRGR